MLVDAFPSEGDEAEKLGPRSEGALDEEELAGPFGGTCRPEALRMCRIEVKGLAASAATPAPDSPRPFSKGAEGCD